MYFKLKCVLLGTYLSYPAKGLPIFVITAPLAHLKLGLLAAPQTLSPRLSRRHHRRYQQLSVAAKNFASAPRSVAVSATPPVAARSALPPATPSTSPALRDLPIPCASIILIRFSDALVQRWWCRASYNIFAFIMQFIVHFSYLHKVDFY